ncbi:YqgQ family protein [Siminovitchia sp. FSL H7-0308]|uniref:YqgQ family protein n=1 Tax=unclassified Siminovitchia TaxID=2837530 RepID=UPI00097DADFF|nr:cytosolic protein [Bacillus sp. VT-16-64]
MKSAFDVQQLLKRFGIFVYLGDREAELQLMEDEIKEIYSAGLITPQDFQKTMIILKSEMNKYKSGH